MSDGPHLRFLPRLPVLSCSLLDATLCACVPWHPLSSLSSPVQPLDAIIVCLWWLLDQLLLLLALLFVGGVDGEACWYLGVGLGDACCHLGGISCWAWHDGLPR